MDEHSKGLPRHACEALRRAREVQGLKQRHIAERMGVSTPYVSQIEKGKKNPSHKVLQEKIGPAYNLPDPFIIFKNQDAAEKSVVVVKKRGMLLEPVSLERDNLVYEIITTERLPKEYLSIAFATLKGQVESRETKHAGEEVIYVIKGNVELSVNGVRYNLETGDLAYYISDELHAVRNVQKDTARVLVVRRPTEERRLLPKCELPPETDGGL